MMGYTGWGLMGSSGWPGMIVQLLLWAGIVSLVVWSVIRLFADRQEAVHEPASDILRRRYARGEITTAKYRRFEQDLPQ